MNHKKCGFKDRVQVCGFKAEDCNSEKCDFFEIEFTAKSIKAMVKKERQEIIRLTDEMAKMKKCGDHKECRDKYQALKKDRKDKVIGMVKLSKAYMYCKRAKL